MKNYYLKHCFHENSSFFINIYVSKLAEKCVNIKISMFQILLNIFLNRTQDYLKIGQAIINSWKECLMLNTVG